MKREDAMDSGSKFGVGLLVAGMVCVLLLMVRLRGHGLYELVLGLFLAAQVVNLVLILRGRRR
jgi:hypothetical protein